MTDKKPDSMSKRVNKKTVAMGVLAALMLGGLIYDTAPMFFESSAPPKPASLEDPLFEEIGETPPRDLVTTSPPQVVSAGGSVSLTSTPVPIETQAVSLPPMTVSLMLPQATQRALTALESQYQSTLVDAANKAKLSETQSAQALQDALHMKPVVIESPVLSMPLTVREQVAQLQLKSIVKGKLHSSAWFEIEGELFPVKEGAWIQDVKVHRLTKNTVVLLDKSGQEHVKYVTQSRPVSEEVIDER
ncbi:hypothetical protein MEG05_16010 [Vibrio aestuarianus]|uniref:hypothetical protein n=1 Tax=Vibrio aestuarianus TaxID=28171 RepID=UPI00237CA33C|nr:hypothetical protein [Vibrio aestuarianus]MDE1315564.1 hypothetical protein [Vibrio aestuarianus]